MWWPAAGHLREADLSAAIHTGQAAVTAFDQDEESLDVITRDYAGYSVEAVAHRSGTSSRVARHFPSPISL
jgi:hypothetical protein